MGVTVRATSGPAIEKPGDLLGIVTSLAAGDVLFIDEIHRMSPAIEEILYPALEDYEVDIVIGQGPSARTVKVRARALHADRRDDAHGAADVAAAVAIRHPAPARVLYAGAISRRSSRRSARIMGVPLEDGAAAEIARRSRGTPRIANRLLRRVRDYAQVRADGTVTLDVARAALKMLEVDEHGFDEIDRKLLRTIIDKFGGGPVGDREHRRRHQRRKRRHRRHLRAVSDSERLSRSHAARTRGDAAARTAISGWTRPTNEEGIRDCGRAEHSDASADGRPRLRRWRRTCRRRC